MTAKNYTESPGWWNLLTLGLTLANATRSVNIRGSTNRAGPAQSKPFHAVEADKVPAVHLRNMLGRTIWVSPASGKGNPTHRTAFAQGAGWTWWVMWTDRELRCIPHGDLILNENSQ